MDTVSSALELSRSFNVLEADYFVKAAWNRVEEVDASLSGFTPLVIYARTHEGLDLANDFDGFLQIDQNVCAEDNNIENQFEEQSDVMDITDSEEESNEDIREPITTYDEALKLVARLKQFAKMIL
ncbi:unnamed protein product [Ceratitis capitata]|uniref:(Mediterranean fruit fly) hypothetical protein n=1 Tax=Ceratitis capitata TaxID=7213 RepID=A0A811U8V2_CERCA|nr:unnamed protein product [Ceratitis capitata]